MQTDWFGTPLRPLDGGYSGETFLVGDHGAEQVLRIYGRNPHRCLIDAALLRLLAGVVPVPQVIECRPADGENPGVLVTERLPGVRLDLVLPEAAADLRVAVAHELGRILAALSGIPQVRYGIFVDADLSISSAGVPDSLPAWAGHFRDTGRLAAWKDEDYEGLIRLLAGAEDELAGDTARARRVLVHSDFNPKNILVDPTSAEVTGLLDWEFAHAGSPYADLGNLTRFERQPAFVDAVVTTLVEYAPVLAGDPLLLGRAADMWALVELAGGSPTNPVRELATQLLLAQARAEDLTAWPWDSPRVDPVAGDAVF